MNSRSSFVGVERLVKIRIMMVIIRRLPRKRVAMGVQRGRWESLSRRASCMVRPP